jgi:hypothetical protein
VEQIGRRQTGIGVRRGGRRLLRLQKRSQPDGQHDRRGSKV